MRSLILGVAGALAFAGVASAHPKLLSASPGAGAAVAGSPQEIRITFSEAIFPKLSGMELTNQAGAVVKTGAASLDVKSKKQLVVPVLTTLTPGRYHVEWHAVSTDTHNVKGQFDFTVK